MIQASCRCGAVALEIEAAPAEATECGCSICRRHGVLWAHYRPGQVRLAPPEPPTDACMRDDRSIAFHRCRTCGCVTHWSPADPARDRTGVNARLMAPEVLASARVRHLDGAGTEEYID